MTDQELLEAAAKNVGIELHVWGDPKALNYAAMNLPGQPRWDPLQDDGDAFRLLMLLRAAKGPTWVLCLSVGDDRSACEFKYASGPDTAANTRRAIVIAAAQEKKTWLKY